MSTVAARLVGGPVARQTGEVVAPPPEWVYFGPSGGFVYRLDPHATPRKIGGKPAVLYRYDRTATAEKLKLLGVPLALVKEAVRDDQAAKLAAAGLEPEGMRERPELAGAEVDVRIELWENEWRVFVAGELEHTVPRGEIDPDDVDAIKELAQQVGKEFIDTAMAGAEA